MTVTVAVDAMGGDHGPSVTVPAALDFLDVDARAPASSWSASRRPCTRRWPKRVRQRATASPCIAASEVVAMDEPPADALRSKKDSSMRVAINLVKEGAAQACVCAGNTGALMAIARFVLKTLPGIDRPAIASQLPTRKGVDHRARPRRQRQLHAGAAPAVRGHGHRAGHRGRGHRAAHRGPAQHRRGGHQGQRRREADGGAAEARRPQFPRQRRRRRHLQGHDRRRGLRRLRRQRRAEDLRRPRADALRRSCKDEFTRNPLHASSPRSPRIRCCRRSSGASTRAATTAPRWSACKGVVVKSHGGADALGFRHAPCRRRTPRWPNGVLERRSRAKWRRCRRARATDRAAARRPDRCLAASPAPAATCRRESSPTRSSRERVDDHRRVDSHAHRHPPAAHRRRRRARRRTSRSHAVARGASRPPGIDAGRHRPHHRRHDDAGHDLPVHRLHPAGEARRRRRRRRSTCRRCARLRLRAGARRPAWSAAAPRAMRWSSAPRCIRASSTGTIAAPACCSATAPARSCSCPPTTPGILASHLHADGSYARHPVRAGPGPERRGHRLAVPADGWPAVFKFAVKVLAEVAHEALATARHAARTRSTGSSRTRPTSASWMRPRRSCTLPRGAADRDGRPARATRPRPRCRSRSTSPCATGASWPATTCCCSASAAASPGAPFSSAGEMNSDDMKFAFVFPGQGSQAVGMMEGFGAHPDRARRRSPRPRTRSARTCGRWSSRVPPRRSTLTVNTQPVMLTAGVAVWRAWQAAGGPTPAGGRRPQPRRIHGARRGGRARVSRCGAAGALSRAGDAGSGARRAPARWPRSWAPTTTRSQAACARGGAGRGGRAGQLQRAGPGRDRRPPRGGRARDRSRRRQQGAKRAVMLPVSAPFHSSLLQPAAERLAARLAERADRRPRSR